MRPVVRFLSIALAMCVAGSASAQRLTGVVRDSASQLGVSGVVVQIMSATGTPVGRAITDRVGAFRIEVSSSGRSLQLRRIGFLPRDLPLPDSAHVATVNLELTVNRVPTTLAPVVTVATGCPATPTGGQALALWEQAQLGFLGTVVARDAAPAESHSMRYRRLQRGTVVMSQMVSIFDTTATRSFASTMSPEMFATYGFATDNSSGGTTYHLPDADVLLDASFRATHCFAMATTTRPGQIGVAFTPAITRPGRIDISGVVWLDQSPLAVRTLDFRFEGVSNLAKNAGSGGFIEFRTADNGVSYIDSWEGRLLALGSVPSVSDAGGPTTRTAGSPLQVDGGLPLSLRWPDGTVVKRTLPTLDGRVVDVRTKAPLQGITVAIPSTPYEAITDSTGAFHFDEMLPGPYAITAVDSAWERFGLGRAVRAGLRISDSASHSATIEMPSLEADVAARCRARHGNGPVFIAGLMTDVAGRPIAGTVDAYLGGIGASAPVTLRVEPNGLFTLCGLEPRRIVIVARDLEGRQKAFDYVVPATGTVHPFTAIIPR